MLARVNGLALAVVGAWLVASLALLLVHTPLRDKHVVILLPPVTLLAGFGLSTAGRLATALLHRPPKWPPATVLATAIAAATYLVTLPRVVNRDLVYALGTEPLEHDPAQQWYADAT